MSSLLVAIFSPLDVCVQFKVVVYIIYTFVKFVNSL